MPDPQPTTPETPVTPPPTTPTPQETTPPSEPTTPEKSLLNEKPEVTVPDKYEDFKVPDGYTLDAEVSKEASSLFKDLGLSQEGAQRLVDFYVTKTKEAFDQPMKEYESQRAKWRDEVRADKEIGGKLNSVLTTISKAIDGLGDAGLARDFREAMDYTGAGDNPVFIKAFYKLAQKVTEGTVVRGNGPAPVAAPNSAPRTAAHALYPNLP